MAAPPSPHLIRHLERYGVVVRDRSGIGAPDGFILTGDAAGADNLLATSVLGIFAAGNVRCGSTKRCAAAAPAR